MSRSADENSVLNTYPGFIRPTDAWSKVLRVPPRGGPEPCAARSGGAGRPPGLAMSREEVIRQGNAAMQQHDSGPVYKWWLARELSISVPTLRGYLREYGLSWPPPWAPA